MCVCVGVGVGGGILKTYFRDLKKITFAIAYVLFVRIYTFSCSAVINKYCIKET